MDPRPATPSDRDEQVAASWPRRLVAEVRSRPFAYGVLAAFLPAGPLLAAWLFPEAPLGVSVVGGLLLGGYAALCAVPQKFL
jgi:4-hydroxybenzoate polyprenyltransferase